jgi:hypothetical protein
MAWCSVKNSAGTTLLFYPLPTSAGIFFSPVYSCGNWIPPPTFLHLNTRGWKRLHNGELHNLCASPSSSIGWLNQGECDGSFVWHAWEGWEMFYKILVEKPKRKRLLGRPMRICENNIRCKVCGKVKVKLSLCLTKHHAMNTYWRSGGIAPRILNLSTRWRWMVSFMPVRFTPRERAPGTRWIWGWVEGKKFPLFSLPGIEPQSSRPYPNRYADWATLEKQGGKVWTEFMWLWLGPSWGGGGALVNAKCRKRRGISWLAELLLAYEEGICFM